MVNLTLPSIEGHSGTFFAAVPEAFRAFAEWYIRGVVARAIGEDRLPEVRIEITPAGPGEVTVSLRGEVGLVDRIEAAIASGGGHS